MVTEEEYIKALRIVETYHQQIGLANVHIRKNIFDLKLGDKIKCLRIRRDSMADTLTIGRDYTITSREGDFVWLRNDKGRVNRYELNFEFWGIAN